MDTCEVKKKRFNVYLKTKDNILVHKKKENRIFCLCSAIFSEWNGAWEFMGSEQFQLQLLMAGFLIALLQILCRATTESPSYPIAIVTCR